MDIVLKISLKNGEKEVLHAEKIKGKMKDDILTFSLEDMEHTLNLQTEEFLRENEEYAFLLDVGNKKSQITLKKEQYNLQVLVEYATLLKNKNEIQLSYFIETDDYQNVLTISWEDDEISD